LARSIVNPGTSSEENAPSKFVRTMHRGDVFRGEMAGSGGYGDPYTREPEAVLNDVRQEKITVKHAAEEYGVVIDVAKGKVDAKATAARRAARPAAS
jgi:N-methylhydantoinase B